MSEKFFEKFLSFFLGFVILLCLVLTAIMFLLLYISNGNIVFYQVYCGSLTFTIVYGIRYVLKFKDFKEKLYLFIPLGENNQQSEQLSMEVEDLPLKVCLYYRNGATQEEIKQNLGLNHPNQVKRELVKGLDILLKFYNEKNKSKKVEPCQN